jgi:hypothetical protein
VKCLAIDETPDLINQSLHELQIEIDYKMLPDIGIIKNAYLHSQLTEKGRSFVNSKEFRLRFLRFELFDIQKSAIRMLKWLELSLSLFGSVALGRPIRISDFPSNEQQVFRKGYIQLMPVRASGTGRRIICIIPYDEDWYTISKQVLQKIVMYTVWIIGNDVDTQRKGMVIIHMFDSSFPQILNHKGAGVLLPSAHWLLSVRLSAIHICTPDTPFFRLRRSAIIIAAGSNRSRLKLHLGTSVELRYALQNYGIPIECIPITHTGKIKLSHIRQWIRLSDMIEDQNNLIVTNYNTNIKSNNIIVVEAPYLNDALFKQGNSFTSHPGNNTLRNLIESKVKQLFDNNPHQVAINQVDTKALVLEIIDEIEHVYGGRFLHSQKSNNLSDYWWVLLHTNGNKKDQKVIFNKIEPLFRKIYTKQMRQQYQLQQQLMNTKKTVTVTVTVTGQNNSNHNEKTGNNESIINDSLNITTIHQNGGTFLFHSLDGKQRITTHDGLRSLRHHDSSNGSDNDSIRPMMASTGSVSSVPSCISSTECFGMKYIPCYDSSNENDDDSIRPMMASTGSVSSVPSCISSTECFGMKYIPCYDVD